ncbi:MAG: trypsin-like serine protease, partial [Deltaproteobacteria bacterium]
SLASSGGVHAKSAALWSERAPGSAPLAQVPDFRALAHQVIPAVVSIAVEQRVRMGRGGGGMGMEGPGGGQDPREFFHRFFGGEMPHEFRNQGLGSGFVIDPQGLILTNWHVVEDAESIEVTYARADGDDAKVKAQVLGSAPNYDVALLKTEEPLGTGLAYLGNSEATDIGDWVMAVGNPFGLSHSVSVGIISAKERRDINPSGRQGLYNFLQTDASINPGNSGGPLINMHGEVIGINSAINAAGSGIGFAIPINMVKEMLPDLKSKGRYTRSWLGIKIQPLSPELAQSFGLQRTTGALVAEVVPDGPAATGGLRKGDVILQFDGHDLRTASDLPLFASMAGTARRVALKLFRGGREMTLSVQLAAFPEDGGPVAQANKQEAGELGMRVADLTPRLQRELGLETNVGVVVRDVEPQGPAARAG